MTKLRYLVQFAINLQKILPSKNFFRNLWVFKKQLILKITFDLPNTFTENSKFYPTYSPDLAPSDFHLFASLAYFITGRTFENLNALKNGLQYYFDYKPVEFYRRGIELMSEKWQKIVINNGNYFE